MVVRRIDPEESELFLKLLCGVFGLDHSRAQGIFYNEPMFDIQRKWALFDGGTMISILTTVPLSFGFGRGIGIAGVATDPLFQGQGYARRLLEAVLEDAQRQGEPSALLFARDKGLYARAGFEELDQVIRGEIIDSVDDEVGPVLSFEQVRAMYQDWSDAHPARLHRDDRRWKYWRWTLRMCAPLEGGYACVEGNIVRECVTDVPQQEWPVGKKAEWFGTTTLAKSLGLRLRSTEFDLYLMGYNVPMQPQMFMTDQF